MERQPLLGPSSEQSGQEEPQPSQRSRAGLGDRSRGTAVSGEAWTQWGPSSGTGTEKSHISPPFPLCCSRHVQERGERNFIRARPWGKGWGLRRGWEGCWEVPAPGWSQHVPVRCRSPGWLHARSWVARSREPAVGMLPRAGPRCSWSSQAAAPPRTAVYQNHSPCTVSPVGILPAVPIQHPEPCVGTCALLLHPLPGPLPVSGTGITTVWVGNGDVAAGAGSACQKGNWERIEGSCRVPAF